LFFSDDVFKSTVLRVSGLKKDIFPKPEVSHKKVKIEVFALDIDFKLGLWVQITPLADFAPKKIKKKQTGSAPRNSKNTYIYIFLKLTLAAMMPLSPHDYV